MSTIDFVARLRELHERAKRGRLPAPERAEYHTARRELSKLLLVAQHLGHGGDPTRRALRVARRIAVDVAFDTTQAERTSTLDIGSGGFAVLLAAPSTSGRSARFTIHAPAFDGGVQPVSGLARVASARVQGDAHRVSFVFEQMDPTGHEHVEMLILDSVLARLSPG